MFLLPVHRCHDSWVWHTPRVYIATSKRCVTIRSSPTRGMRLHSEQLATPPVRKACFGKASMPSACFEHLQSFRFGMMAMVLACRMSFNTRRAMLANSFVDFSAAREKHQATISRSCELGIMRHYVLRMNVPLPQHEQSMCRRSFT